MEKGVDATPSRHFAVVQSPEYRILQKDAVQYCRWNLKLIGLPVAGYFCIHALLLWVRYLVMGMTHNSEAYASFWQIVTCNETARISEIVTTRYLLVYNNNNVFLQSHVYRYQRHGRDNNGTCSNQLLEKLLEPRRSRLENDASARSKSDFGLEWPWPLTWPSDPQSWPFYALPRGLYTCANLRENRFTRFQNIVFIRLATEERTDGRMPLAYPGGGINLHRRLYRESLTFVTIEQLLLCSSAYCLHIHTD